MDDIEEQMKLEAELNDEVDYMEKPSTKKAQAQAQ